MMRISKYKVEKNLIIPLILFAIISVITIYSAMTYTKASLGNLALKQIIWYSIGIIVIFLTMKISNKFFFKYAYILYIIGNILLIGLFFFAEPVNNSRCWYVIPYIGSFQPSEFMKIILILILSKIVEDYQKENKKASFRNEFFLILKMFILVMIPSILTFLQPDTGAVLIYFIIFFAIVFTSGIHMRWFVITGIISLVFISIFLSLFFLKQDLFIKYFGTDFFYRIDRILDWRKGVGMQLENSLAAIGSSGIFGHGFNKTPIYFPESSTDFIFAVFASNFGLIGSLLLIALILFFDLNLVHLSTQSKQNINKYTIAGILGMLIFQQVQNISMTLGLLPITGITLPFISYGGSSLISYMVMIGILFNISHENITATK